MAASETSKSAVDQLTREFGGEMKANPSSLPRNCQQISNFRREKASKVFYRVMGECKLTQGSDAFIHDVKTAPSPQSVLFFDWRCRHG